MSILVGRDTRLMVQGITGARGQLPRASKPRVRREPRIGRHARTRRADIRWRRAGL